MRVRPAWLPILLMLAGGAACSREPAGGGAPLPLVRVFTVSVRPDEPLELRGSVAARSRIRLGFRQMGVVAEVLVEEGQHVRSGQLLARLDDVDARAARRIAVARRDKARRDADRATRLAQEGAVATGARDDALTQLVAAEAQLVEASEALERTRLLAPESGAVFARSAEPGEAVGPGSPVVILDTTGALIVKAAVSERELLRLHVGQGATVTTESGARPLAARVTSLATTPSPADGLYPLELTPTAALGLPPGALVRVRLEARAAATTLRIPIEALVHRLDRDFVFQVEDRGRVHQLPIQVDRAEGREVVVRSGLRGGERIVAEGAYFLQDGQAVRTLE